jgi:hypothetical protein
MITKVSLAARRFGSPNGLLPDQVEHPVHIKDKSLDRRISKSDRSVTKPRRWNAIMKVRVCGTPRSHLGRRHIVVVLAVCLKILVFLHQTSEAGSMRCSDALVNSYVNGWNIFGESLPYSPVVSMVAKTSVGGGGIRLL